ncbi:hypothetical protein [Fodinicola feengrottensis]|nr:hypothetical protein [Fodinicola feengrottensis]
MLGIGLEAANTAPSSFGYVLMFLGVAGVGYPIVRSVRRTWTADRALL